MGNQSGQGPSWSQQQAGQPPAGYPPNQEGLTPQWNNPQPPIRLPSQSPPQPPYNRYTPPLRPGQFSPHGPPPPKRKSKIGCGVVVAIVVLLIFIIAAAGGSHSSTATLTPTATTQAVQGVTTMPTVAADSPVATPRPTLAPTSTIRATPTTKPTTVAARPTPKPTGVNGNPYGYNFNLGKTITNPPSDFCSYFNCIPTFVEPDDPGDGYVVECGDGTYSQSGVERGACSRHGGVQRPLYSH